MTNQRNGEIMDYAARTTAPEGVTRCCNEPPDRTIDPTRDCCPACGAVVEPVGAAAVLDAAHRDLRRAADRLGVLLASSQTVGMALLQVRDVHARINATIEALSDARDTVAEQAVVPS